ncbi:FmdB family zinc ribbon protein [Caballeronia ptereochthonis]|uniref:FmdB family regulatory protein n=1 Tax=Caballeronia ptereochthonis TaxID=1777144 RepID=A0A158DQ24_9BURK|nr:FmdB family zinc ribbon protein [Caballeronia ptereochthonis]SAK96675.1 FmdB family regulatory protein [Caballeronia ptereochthonis]
MPIYAYRCANCGHEKDVLQKLSDAPLTQCPACGTDAFSKQVTAAGFQLKGSGWYVTDFRGGNSGKSGGDGGSNDSAGASKASAPKSEETSASSSSADSATPASTSSSDAGKPAAGASASSGAA